MAKQTNYARGSTIERKRVKFHKDSGALIAQRSAGSHSAVDLFAIYDASDEGTICGKIIFEQIKRTKKQKKIKEPAMPMGGLYWVEFRVKHWVDQKGFQDELES